jgi:hypothetical protein
MLKISSRAFAIVAAYLRNDLDGVLALVGYGDAELLPIVVEIPTRLEPIRVVSGHQQSTSLESMFPVSATGLRNGRQ